MNEGGKGSERAIFEEIHTAIIERRLQPGTKLGEEALCEIYELSRGQVRRVLVELSHSKVVELRPNRGAYVAQPSVREARNVFEARRALEAAIVERAIDRVTTSTLNRLRAIVEEDRQALARGDREASIKLSGDFHLCLAEIAGNDVLTGFQRELVSRSSLIIATFGEADGPECSVEHHGGIIEALEFRDGRAASCLMEAHLVHIEGRLRLDVDAGKSPPDLKAILSRG